MLNSRVAPKFVDWNFSLKKQFFYNQRIILNIFDYLHIYKLHIRRNIIEILNIFDSEAKLGWIRIVGENINNASWK